MKWWKADTLGGHLAPGEASRERAPIIPSPVPGPFDHGQHAPLRSAVDDQVSHSVIANSFADPGANLLDGEWVVRRLETLEGS